MMATPKPDRRWGCIVPISLIGLTITAGGLSLIGDWWRDGGVMYIEFLLLSLCVGPGLLVFAVKVYRDPTF